MYNETVIRQQRYVMLIQSTSNESEVDETVKKLDLSRQFSESITKECADFFEPIAEVVFDSLLDEETVQKIPFVSSVVSAFHLGKMARERYATLKLYSFIGNFNKGICDERQRDKYISIFQNDTTRRNRELTYLLIILDRYIDWNKPQLLAKTYLAYLHETITWVDFMKYAEIIDRLLPGDLELLKEGMKQNVDYQDVGDGTLRLVSLGLMVPFPDTSRVEGTTLVLANGNVQSYMWTKFGEIFVKINFDAD